MKILFYSINDKVDGATLSSFLNANELSEVHNIAVKISKTWYHNGDYDFTRFNELSIGSLFQIKIFFYVEKLEKCKIFVNKIIKMKQDTVNVLIEDEDYYDIIKKIVKAHKLEIKVIKKFKSSFNKEEMKNFIKKNNLELIFKFASEKAINNRKKQNSNNILLIQEVNNKSMIKMIEKLELELNPYKTTTLCIGKYMFTSINNKNKIVSIDYFKLKFLNQSIKNRSKLENIIRKNKLIIEGNICNFSGNFDSIYDFLYSIVHKELLGIFLYYYSIDKLLTNLNVSKIFLPSDSHCLSRMICQLSRKHKISTYVMQHGSVGDVAFTPIYSDTFFAWGKLSKDLLVSYGEAEENIKLVGNIKYKYEVKSNIEYIKKQNYNLLWAVNPVGKDINKKLFNFLSETMCMCSYINELTLKMHPGSDERSFFQELVDETNNKKIKIANADSDIISLIDNNDIIVITQSTTGIEAIMRNKIILLYDDKLIPEILPYKRYNSALCFQNKEDLIRCLSSLDNTVFNKTIRNGKKFLKEYMLSFNKKEFNKIVFGDANE